MPFRSRLITLFLCLNVLLPLWVPAQAASDPNASSTAATAPPDERPDSRSSPARAATTPSSAPEKDAAPASAAGEPAVEGESEPADTAPAESATEPEPAETGALVEGGLLAQVFVLFDQWTTGLGEQLREATSAIGDLRNIDRWWDSAFRTPEAEREALRGIAKLVAIVAVALVAEWLIHWLLRRPRQIVAQQASARELHAQERDSVREAHLTAVGTEVAPAQQGAARASRGALHERRKAAMHSGLLRRMPYAFGDALLNALPIVAFIGAVALLMSTQGGTTSQFYAVTLPVINAYIGVRITLSILRLMASPAGQGLRLIHMPDSSAAYMFRWARTIFIVAAAGMAFAEVALHIGAGYNMRTLLTKLTSLVVHLLLIVVVLQTRHTVSARIRGTATADEGSGSIRAFLAEIWPYAATFIIAAFWVVWALSVANGFQRAVKFLAISAAVLATSRLLWILVVGILDRSFERESNHLEALTTGGVERYHALFRRLINVVFIFATGIALLEAWGINAMDWFAAGTVGRRFASAAITIAVAAVLAILIWEAVSLALRRRIQAWSDSGDTVRAARLRTLVPMIRTLVFVVIALVVVMTALNELGVNIAPLLAGASIIGVALGFGSQKLVQDFITGIFLLMENAMQVGDFVTVAGVSGTVEYLSIRTVRLRAGDGSLHVVPFSSVTTVNNVNRGIGNAAVRVNVTADSDVELVFSELRAIAAQMRTEPEFADLILDDLSLWGVDQIDGATITIAGQIRSTDKGRWAVQREFNRRVLEQFRRRGIALANPKETLVTTVKGPQEVSTGTSESPS